jgi:anti-sigma factor RsiW
MDCTRYETALSEHALGEPLSPALEAHLASCEACRAELASGQRLRVAIDAALDGVRQIEPSPTFLARARAAALEASRPSPRFGPFGRLAWNPAAAVAMVALAAALGVIMARGPQRSADPIAPSPAASPGPSVRPSSTAPPAAASLPPAVLPVGGGSRLARTSADRLAVLVPPGQEEAIVRLAVLVATGAVAPPASLVNPPDPTQPLTPPAELSLPPLAIEPLGPANAENEGVMP